MMGMQTATYKVSDCFDAITSDTDINSLTRQISWTDEGGTSHVVAIINSTSWHEFFSNYKDWKFTVSVFGDPLTTPAAALAALTQKWGEFFGRKAQGVEDAVKAFWKEYSFGADYQEDKTVTTTYGHTKDSKATAQQMADTRNGKNISESFPTGTSFAFSTISQNSGTAVDETTSTAAYDGTLKQDAKTAKNGDVASSSGANSWNNETEGGTDTIHTVLSGTKGDIAEKIRTEVEFRIRVDVGREIMKQFIYECMWFDGGEDE